MVIKYTNETMEGLTVEIVVRVRKYQVFQSDLKKSEDYESKCGLLHQPLRTTTDGALLKQMVGMHVSAVYYISL